MPPNETVEKPIFQSSFPGQQLVEGLNSRSEGGETGGEIGKGSVDRPEGVDLADVVYPSEPRTRPLYIYFPFGPQREAVHALVHTDVGEDWLDNADLLA